LIVDRLFAMTWFTENPTPLVLLGTLVASIAAFLLLRTGSRAALWGLLGTVAVTIAAVAANMLIVTPREQVIATLEEIRTRVEANDSPELLKYIDPSPTPRAIELRNRVQYDLANVTVESAKINDLKVLIGESGTTAKAEFIGIVDIKAGGGMLPPHIVLQFTVDLKKVDDRWIVTGADYVAPKISAGGGDIAVPPDPTPLAADRYAGAHGDSPSIGA
jgi:hypothetical protein